MKKPLILAATLMAFSFILVGCSTSEVNTSAVTSNAVDNTVVIPDTAITRTYEVADMFCVGCAFGIQAAMLEIDGVYTSNVDYETATGDVTYDPELVSEQEIIDAALPYTFTFN